MSQNKYAIIGFPLAHSMSPFIHRRLFDISGMSAVYEMLEIPPEKLESEFDLLREYSGFNVTIPHKLGIIKMCDRLAGAAEVYSSVNCVKCGDEVVGYNTDAEGFLRCKALRQGRPARRRRRCEDCALRMCGQELRYHDSGQRVER